MKLLCKSADERYPGAQALNVDVDQRLNLGAPPRVEPRERAELAAMNLTAGRKAKERGAPPAAAGFFEAGISALPDGSFKEDHELAFSLHAEAAECAYLGGQVERAESLLDVLAAEARSDLERARAYELRIALCTTQGRLEEALALGTTALAMLGVPLPEDGPARKAAADAELAAARAALGTRRLRDLLDEPETSDPRTRAALRLLMTLTMPASLICPPLCTFIAARQVNLSLERGHGGVFPYGYMAYAWMAARVLRRYDEAYELGELALELNERSGQDELTCRLRLVLGAHISVFTKHLLSSLDLFKEAHEAGLRTGDITYVAQTCVHNALVRFGLGDECEAVRAEVDGSLTLVQRGREELALAALTGVRRALDDLMSTAPVGASRAPEPVVDEAAAAYEEKLSAPAYGAVAFIHCALRQQVCFLLEDYEGALRMGSLAEAKMQGGVDAHLATEVSFYTCLTLLSPALSRGRQLTPISVPSYRDRLAEWAERCPDNYRHKHLLVRAESARAAGEELAAMKLYDQAIEAAKVNGFVRDEALASELCAKFHLASGRERIAHVYMTDAHEAYLRWGATAKVRQLSRKYPHLVARTTLFGQASRPPEAAPPASAQRPASLDALAVLRASRALHGELVQERLFERLLQVLRESTGARRAVLLLARDGALTVEAELAGDAEGVRIGAATPLECADDLAANVVQHVAQTQQPVVLATATSDERFAQDPYLIEAGPRSILCLAMTHQGRLTGVLYAENDAGTGAFRAGQLELCGLLASQAAVAVNNALRYRDAQSSSIELRRCNEALAAEVARLTEELRACNREAESPWSELRRCSDAR
ncbi:GAF domain-containing protein [Sorangium sp. So ce260]|uniref:GAF domain-containing protein n=1 Tax=Sorangium sp. So ce260 TaxID=3133291 RepID=UPI003F611C66